MSFVFMSISVDKPIVVIGGGPAGACASALLARMGLDVVLLERERFPRAHVGESLLPGSMPILESLGVMEEVREAGFTVKPGATMIWGTEREPWSWYFSETHATYPHSYQVWRPEFDAILLNNAQRSGVDVREGWQVTRVVFDEGGSATAVRCRATDGSSGEVELPACYVVDASGQSGVLARQLGLLEWDDFFRNLAVYGYYEGGERLPEPDAGNILIESQSDGWLWHIPLRMAGRVLARWWMRRRDNGGYANRVRGASLNARLRLRLILRRCCRARRWCRGRRWCGTGLTAAGRCRGRAMC